MWCGAPVRLYTIQTQTDSNHMHYIRCVYVWSETISLEWCCHRIIISLLWYQWITYWDEEGKDRMLRILYCCSGCSSVTAHSTMRNTVWEVSDGERGRLITKWEQILTYFPSAKIRLITYWLASRRDFDSFLGLAGCSFGYSRAYNQTVSVWKRKECIRKVFGNWK